MNVTTPIKAGCWCGGTCPHIEPVRQLTLARKFGRAEMLCKRILLDAPACPEAHRAMASLLCNDNRSAFAGGHLAAAGAVTGTTPALALQAADTLRNAAKVPEAITVAYVALDLNRENPNAYALLAGTLQADGRLDEASAVVTEAEKRFGRVRAMRRISAVVLADRKDYAGAIELLSADDLDPLELFDRGRCHEKRGDYAAAWRDWMAGKQFQREKLGCIYDVTRFAARIDALHEFAQPARFRYLRGCEMPRRRPWPLFITGFPRSGTTMIEAALSSHRWIVAGDELSMLSEVIGRVPSFLNVRAAYPRALMAMAFPENVIMPGLMRDYYQRKAWAKIGIEGPSLDCEDGAPGGPQYFTDKMPSNELHWPLIRLLFPETPILHVRRHPLDIIVSNMSHSLVHGAFNACALEWNAAHLARIDDLLVHYKKKVPALDVIEVRYENFVADHRTHIDAMLPRDLAPDEKCYDFHLNPWHSRTISHRQIKEPVHDRSVGRYKPFLEFLRPIVPTIERMAEREGYAI